MSETLTCHFLKKLKVVYSQGFFRRTRLAKLVKKSIIKKTDFNLGKILVGRQLLILSQ